jgi:hypothetical protein
MREWDGGEGEAERKKMQTEGERARMEDQAYGRQSPPDGKSMHPSPGHTRRRSSEEGRREEIRREELRRVDEDRRREEDRRRADRDYHPSEAAHHVQMAPMQMGHGGAGERERERERLPGIGSGGPGDKDGVKGEEPAARKMEVDEDYDDDGDDGDKRMSGMGDRKSPKPRENGERRENGMVNGGGSKTEA